MSTDILKTPKTIKNRLLKSEGNDIDYVSSSAKS